MSRNRSLEEFVGTSRREETASEEMEADEAIEPAVSTYQWTGEALDCERCGADANQRWRDGDELVCESCKEW